MGYWASDRCPNALMDAKPVSAVDVAILGGGAAGALVALHLIGRGVRVALVEPRAAAALGAAYCTARGEHLLNVNAARMSAFDDRPGDFLDYLAGHRGEPQSGLTGTFAARREYGRYLQDRLAAASTGKPLDVHPTSAVDLAPDAGGYRVQLEDGRVLSARAVVLALGNLPAALPGSLQSLAPGQVVNAWQYEAVAGIDPAHAVGIVGAGLSMVDTLLTLHANGHRGPVVALSRHGLMPLSHAPGTRPQAGGVEPLLSLGVRQRMRLLRQWAAAAQADGGRWQDALERLRPHVQALWNAWPEAEQRRFLRHAVRHWDIHRHRIAPEVAATVEAMRRDGRFSLHAGRLGAVTPTADARLRMAWQPRGGDTMAAVTVDRIVNATGTEKRIDRAPAGLLPALQARGLVSPGPHGIGIDTLPDGQVQGAGGVAVAGLWTLGALRIGSLWESIAMPELRGQALRVAEAAMAHLQLPDR